MQQIFFNFHGVIVSLESSWPEALEAIKNDFKISYIEEKMSFLNCDFELRVEKEAPPLERLPKVVASMQSANSISYDEGELRYNDYYGELLSVLDTDKNKAIIYSLDLKKVHETAYQMIISRVGKCLDLEGLHKLHGFSVSFKDVALVCMMPSKGGKSTLMMEFLKDPRFKIISADVPLVDRMGRVTPFPIKLDPQNFPGQIEGSNESFKKIILVEAFRYNCKFSILKEASWPQTIKGLFRHGVAGMGLPGLFEYFWEKGFKDFLVRLFIFASRAWAFTMLFVKSKRMKLLLGTDAASTYKEIVLFTERNFDKI